MPVAGQVDQGQLVGFPARGDLRDSRRQPRLDLPSSSRGYLSLRRPPDPCCPQAATWSGFAGLAVMAALRRKRKLHGLVRTVPTVLSFRETNSDPVGSSPARTAQMHSVEGIRRVPAEQWRGDLGYLAAIAPLFTDSCSRCQTVRPPASPPRSARRARLRPSSPDCGGSRSPAYSKYSSAREDAPPARAKPRTRSPTD